MGAHPKLHNNAIARLNRDNNRNNERLAALCQSHDLPFLYHSTFLNLFYHPSNWRSRFNLRLPDSSLDCSARIHPHHTLIPVISLAFHTLTWRLRKLETQRNLILNNRHSPAYLTLSLRSCNRSSLPHVPDFACPFQWILRRTPRQHRRSISRITWLS